MKSEEYAPSGRRAGGDSPAGGWNGLSESHAEVSQWSFGAEYVDAQGNYRDIFRQPETRDALSFFEQGSTESLYNTGAVYDGE